MVLEINSKNLHMKRVKKINQIFLLPYNPPPTPPTPASIQSFFFLLLSFFFLFKHYGNYLLLCLLEEDCLATGESE